MKTNSPFNNRVRQILMLVLLIAMTALLFSELYPFFPGFLGALTLYILSREWFFYLTIEKSWNKSATALLFMTAFLICIVAPVYISFQLLFTKISVVFQNPNQITEGLKTASDQVRTWTGRDLLTPDVLKDLQKGAAGIIPKVLNNSAVMIGNLLMILFLSFFMFKNGAGLENTLSDSIPLRKENIASLARETKMMVKANALGIPLISLIQGGFALIGYWIFGVHDFVLLGFITGICAFFPVIGTALVWIPLVIYLFSSGEKGHAIGLLIYSLILTGNIDYLARITFLKKIGNVHPVITILGLIVGLKLFGFWGFIFGPLLISYFLLLLKIYTSEFGHMHSNEADVR